MKKAKIISALLSLGVTFSMTLPFASSAIAYPYKNYDELTEYFSSRYTKTEDQEWSFKDFEPNRITKDIYYRINDDWNGTFILVERIYDSIKIKPTEGADIQDKLSEITADNSDIKVYVNTDKSVGIYANSSDGNIDRELVKQIRDALQDSASSIEYFHDRYTIRDWNFQYITDYYTMMYDDPEEKLTAFIEENNIDAEIVLEKGKVRVVPSEETSPEEHLELAKQIKGSLGFTTLMYTPADAPQEIGSGIELVDSVDGDANADGDLSIDDAVTVMQSIANPDKYKLTAQGEFNADMNGDGITAKDALMIQEKLLKM